MAAASFRCVFTKNNLKYGIQSTYSSCRVGSGTIESYGVLDPSPPLEPQGAQGEGRNLLIIVTYELF